MSEVHDQLARDLAGASTVMLLGALDTGKTTLARRIARYAASEGRVVGMVDADVDNSTIGPPTCVGLRLIKDPAEVDEPLPADYLHFVGTLSPSRLVLQQVIATTSMVERAREAGANLVVIDTTATVSGVAGETLKYHKMELARPDRVVALQRGSEMEPIVGMLHRFFTIDVDVIPAEPETTVRSPDERAQRRAEGLRVAFAGPLERWRVRPTVFAPTLPTGLDLERLDELLVGIHDGNGHCLGLGRLEYEDGAVRVLTNVGEGMKGLRLGSVRIDLETFETRPVSLREVMFGF
ncbi:MAG TPA: Clp1/GlmU family protein [Acidimicrobiia bacterium]|nr:Clp1/GlmU family protein [Acidimicrobiia bacterium]